MRSPLPALVFCLAFGAPVFVAAAPPVDDPQLDTSARSYPYTASAERARVIHEGARQLRRCMTKDEVRALLGTPDDARTSYGPKGPAMKFQGWSWTYYLAKRDSGANDFDPLVFLVFTTQGRLSEVKVYGTADISRLDASPGESCP